MSMNREQLAHYLTEGMGKVVGTDGYRHLRNKIDGLLQMLETSTGCKVGLCQETKFSEIAHELAVEASRAAAKYPPFNSAHEGFAILDEERDELWNEVKINQSFRVRKNMRKEAIQVGAMALRFITDICDTEGVIRR